MGDLIPFPARRAVSLDDGDGAVDGAPASRPGVAPDRDADHGARHHGRPAVSPTRTAGSAPVIVDLPLRTVLGDVLREARRARGERLADVADAAAISAQYLSEVERGIKDPSSEIVRAIGRALDLTTLDLLERSADRLRSSSTGPVLLAA